MQAHFSDHWILKLLIVLTTTSFLGGVFAGIATLIITRKNNFPIEIFRLLIGAIAGYEALVIWDIFYLKDKNLNEILEVIISHNQNFLHYLPMGILTIFNAIGAIGASIAIFMMRKVFRWRS
ncbi:MAG: hypothetical protein HWQ41_15290 [Nostoc sp. NOS(2021)]|uniref:hypothetical protein n=1 Tax=Nostoc sp. NOS(2021) TaxID=2815407 RepID=UPI0025F69FD2|nr:hypothetical protein [Nostoc sp. NOS(2021)]MBN3896571.1 hypothetical protein [Nostoc sp. NOS(2021)]